MSNQEYQYTRHFNQPAEKVWRFLTESEKLSRWLLPNDFSLNGDGAFHMWTSPSRGWDGVLRGQVKEFSENKSLSYDLKISSSYETSTLNWAVNENDRGATLSMNHEGSSQLIETIYQAINETTVSGHLRQGKEAPVASSIRIDDGSRKQFLEALREEVLSDPFAIEENVLQAAQKYPQYVEHIVCIAVDAFPERAVSILEKVKGGSAKQFQKLLGLTLFLLLFKGAIDEAQAEVLTQEIVSTELDEDSAEEIAASLEDIEEKEKLRELLLQSRNETTNANLRVAAGIAIAVVVLANADRALAADILDALKIGEGNMIANEDVIVTSATGESADLSGAANSSLSVAGLKNVATFKAGLLGKDLKYKQLEVDADLLVSKKSFVRAFKDHEDHPHGEEVSENQSVSLQSEASDVLLVAQYDEEYLGEEFDFDLITDYDNEIELDDEIDLALYFDFDDAGAFLWEEPEDDFDEDEEIAQDESLEIVDDHEIDDDDEILPWEELWALIDYVQNRSGEEVHAIVINLEEPGIYFAFEPLEDVLEDFEHEHVAVFEVNHEERDLEQLVFDLESEGYSIADAQNWDVLNDFTG